MSEIKNKRQAAQILARIIAENPTAVKDALFESGVDLSPTADDRQVIESVVNNIGRNRMLQDKIGSLADSQEYFNIGEGGGGEGGGFFSDSANVQAVGALVGQGLGFWLGARREKKQGESQQALLEQQQELARINADIVQGQLEVERAKSGNQSQGMSRGAKIAIGVGAIGVVGLVLFLAFKGRKGKA